MTSIIRKLEIGDRAFGWVVLICFIALLAHKPAINLIDDLTTPQPWFSVQFKVPDHRHGNNPDVTYKRTINRPVHGHWSVRIFSPPSNKPYVCAGSGYAYYQPETEGTITLSFHDFIGARCRPRPGVYEACSLYELTDSRQVTRNFGPFCSRFTVHD